MQPSTTALVNRPDTFLGVCEGIGQDFGFNANWLRVILGIGVLWNPVAMIAVYALLGTAVLASRLAFPNRVAAARPVAIVAVQPEPLKMAA